MTEEVVIDNFSEDLAKKFIEEDYNRAVYQNYIDKGINVVGGTASLVSGPLFPIVDAATEALKWGYSFLWDDFAKMRQEAERKAIFKEGVRYKNPNVDAELAALGGPSTKAVPLSPDIDPAAWEKRKSTKAVPLSPDIDPAAWEKRKTNVIHNGIPYRGTEKMPLVPIMPTMSYGWSHNYESQKPQLVVDLTKGKVNIHPHKTMNPNATMVPSGGFSGRSNSTVPNGGFSDSKRRRIR